VTIAAVAYLIVSWILLGVFIRETDSDDLIGACVAGAIVWPTVLAVCLGWYIAPASVRERRQKRKAFSQLEHWEEARKRANKRREQEEAEREADAIIEQYDRECSENYPTMNAIFDRYDQENLRVAARRGYTAWGNAIGKSEVDPISLDIMMGEHP
jgi:hypothetical protein